MKKLFFILLLVVIASFHAVGAIAASNPRRCTSIFSNGDNEAATYIQDMLSPLDVKRRLLKQTYYNVSLREFVVEFSRFIDDLYLERFTEATEGKETNYKALGYKSTDEVRALKEDVLNKQIQILSVMNSNDLTAEFTNDFKRIATRIYDSRVSKYEVLAISRRLNQVIRFYSN